jgi:heat shock transcription factor
VSTSATLPPTPKVAHQAPPMGTVTELFDTSPADTSATAYVKNSLRNNPQEGMMKIIQDTNAVNSAPAFDLPEVAAKTPASMSDDQRTQMLNIMARNGSSAAPSTAGTVAVPTPSPSATVATTAATAPANPDIANLSLSPNLSSIPGMPSLQELQNTQAQLEVLQRLQAEQAEEINALTQMLGPLSPSGRIPGLDEHGNPNTSYFDSVDYDQFIHPNAFSDPNFEGGDLDGMGGVGGTDGADFNFSLDGNTTTTNNNASTTGNFITGVDANNAGQATTDAAVDVKTASPNNTPSPAATEEIDRADFGDSPERGTKRRRKA